MASNNGSGTNRTDAYTKAVNKATSDNKADAASTSDVEAMPLQKGASIMIQNELTKADLAAFLAEDGYEYAPQLFTMQPFSRIDGILEGNGLQAELSKVDPVTKEVTVQVVDTWIIRDLNGGQRVSILDTIQLHKKLPPFVGEMVSIFRGDDVKTGGGFKTTNYMVRGPKLPDGKVRSFVIPPKSTIIDAKSIETPNVARIAAPVASAGGEDAQA
jgi:hypothetical protein